MRIAQVSPLIESVPPKSYGGTERIVSYLTEELVAQGHDVTLFASGDSVTKARLVACSPQSLRLDPGLTDPAISHLLMLERVSQESHHFDLVHFHLDYLHFPTSRRGTVPHVTTLHGRLDLRQLQPLYQEFRDVPVVSISNAQRKPLKFASWQGTVLHGLPRDLYQFREKPGDYLAFLGRISPEKRVDRAIRIARRLNMRIRIAAKVDAVDRGYFEEHIAPMLSVDGVEYVGEIGDAEKNTFLGEAAALLFPIDWPEPFGLVMIEAMACGTPVVAYRGGSVEEIIDPGESGFIVDGLEQAVRAVSEAVRLDRHRVRRVFERRFTADRMARDYVEIYHRVLGGRRAPAA